MSNKKNEKMMDTTEVHDSSLHLSPTLPKDDEHRISVPIDHPDSSIPPSKLDIVNQPSEGKVLAYTKEDKLKWIEEQKMKEHDSELHISPTLPRDDIHRTSIPIDHPDHSIPIETKCIGEITDKQHGLKKAGLHEDSHYRLHDLSNMKDHRGEITDIQHGIRKEGLHRDSHKRKHKLSSKEDHEGRITLEQHGSMTKIPDAHHKALHAKSHLEGGKDELPWGEGGGLDADTVDGFHASELRTPLYAGAIGKNRFIELDDTPSTYSGQAGKYPRVKTDETGLEFATVVAGVGTFKDLTDTPDTYSTHGGKHVTVKSTEDGLEFSVHDKAVHDALNIDADTLDTKHYSDISNEIDSKIDTHASLTQTHGAPVGASLEHTANKNIANGYAGLDANADVPLAQIPDTLTGKDADTLDTKHYSDISAEIDNEIAIHKSDASAHHIKTGHDEVRGLLAQGLEIDRPTAGIAGRLFYATDEGILYRDNGTAWEEILRAETSSRLASLAEKSHASLTNITSSDHHIKTTSVTELTDHDKATHDALLIDADTVDGIQGADIFKKDGTVDMTGYGLIKGSKVEIDDISRVSVESFKTTGYGSLGTGGVWADLLTLNITLSNDSTCWIFANIPRVACPKGYITQFRILIDDETESYLRGFYKHTSGSYVDSWSDYKTVTVMRIESLTAGSHTLKLQWNTQSATAYAGSSSALVILGVIAWG